LDQELLSAFEKYKAELLNFMLKRLSTPDLAQDLLHELYLKLDSYQSASAITAHRAFLYRAANNLMADYYRAQSRRDKKHEAAAELEEQDIDHRTPELIALQCERLAVVEAAINELPAKCQEVFKLCRYEQLEKNEIAERLGISSNMVEKHLRKALLYCQSKMEDYLGEG